MERRVVKNLLLLERAQNNQSLSCMGMLKELVCCVYME